MPVRKAVIPAAGFGTRFLPASKAVPKMLLPVVDRPVIQYAVEEIVRAGVTDICIVVSQGGELIADHFGTHADLESALEAKGKVELLEEVRRLSDLADIYYVRQDRPLGLGHAVGVAREHVGDEPFLVLLPDELFDPNENLLSSMVEDFDEGRGSVIAVAPVAHKDIHLYGAIEEGTRNDDLIDVISVVEKPDPAEAPSDLAIIGRYVLEPEIFDAIDKTDPGAGGEIQLTDALGAMAGQGRLRARVYEGRRWDAGKKETYLRAVVELAAERKDLGPEFRQFLEEFTAGLQNV